MGKVLLAISNHSRMLGGGEHSFLDLLSGLPDHWTPIASVASDGPLAEKLRSRSIQVEMAKIPPIRPWRLVQVLRSIKRYCDSCIKHKVAVIYANGSRAAFYGGLAGRILRIPVIWHCRITTTDPILDFMLVKFVSRIVVNSKATAKRFQAKHRSKIIVVYNGIPIRWFKQEQVDLPCEYKADWKTILLVARVSKSKGHDLAIDAFERIAESDSKLHLVCVGEKDHSQSSWWDYLLKRSENSRFSNRIHWVGPAEDVRQWYKVARLMIFPSENESFGRVLVEAMTCGVPVVATRGGGVQEIVRNDQEGILVTPREANGLAEAMIRVLNDDILKHRFIRAGRERANYFDLDIHVSNMVGVFDDLAAV